MGANATYTNLDGVIGMLEYVGTIYYFPIGLSYFGKNGFNFGIDLVPGLVTMGTRRILSHLGILK